jgi:DNA-binding NtrC family response regulator
MAMLKVLHADDKLEWRQNVIRWLNYIKEFEFEFASFEALSEAKVAYKEAEFDLLILDGNVEKPFDGWDWAKELSKDPNNRVIVMSSFDPDDLADLKEEFGCDKILNKSGDVFEEFPEVVTALLKEKG